jgi:hypothetical protein
VEFVIGPIATWYGPGYVTAIGAQRQLALKSDRVCKAFDGTLLAVVLCPCSSSRDRSAFSARDFHWRLTSRVVWSRCLFADPLS